MLQETNCIFEKKNSTDDMGNMIDRHTQFVVKMKQYLNIVTMYGKHRIIGMLASKKISINV